MYFKSCNALHRKKFYKNEMSKHSKWKIFSTQLNGENNTRKASKEKFLDFMFLLLNLSNNTGVNQGVNKTREKVERGEYFAMDF